MADPSRNRLEEIKAFRSSISTDFYTPHDIVDWDIIESELDEMRSGINALQKLVDSDSQSEIQLAETLAEVPASLCVVRHLFSISAELNFDDGGQLPIDVPSSKDAVQKLAHLLVKIGLWRLMVPSSRVGDLVRVALVAADASKRRFRMLESADRRVEAIARQACQDAAVLLGMDVKLVPNPKEFIRRGVDFLITANGTPVAAIVNMLISTSGGRQARELSRTYPALQQELSKIPLALILIADGAGMQKIPPHTLDSLRDSVAALMSINQAHSGYLKDAILAAIANAGHWAQHDTPLDLVIESALESQQAVEAAHLPIDRDAARLALARYVEEHPTLALTLAPDATSLHWTRAEQVQDARALRNKFDEDKALRLFEQLLSVSTSTPAPAWNVSGGTAAIVHIGAGHTLPASFLLVAHSIPNTELYKCIAQYALHNIQDAKLAVLSTPVIVEKETAATRRLLQRSLPVNVVTLDPDDLLKIAKSSDEPRQHFAAKILEQSDLTKISPFVLSNATPERMFYGRDSEEATLLNSLTESSVSILGSRRMGKTSLLLHAKKILEAADYLVFYGDCQTVLNWSDFARMARRQWHMSLSSQFQPDHLFELVEQLRDSSASQLVILLDEIDQLLDWDQHHSSVAVPEAFFRACRSISQGGSARFVFSGERTIATKLWDPQSPHWNFCRPLPLRQLDRNSLERLIIEPIAELQIRIEDPDDFKAIVWEITSGHPHVAQYLGDSLIRLLNEREPAHRNTLTSADVKTVAETFEFRERYTSTYFGQATDLERLIALLIMSGVNSVLQLIELLNEHGVVVREQEIGHVLRMLDLYGIIRGGAQEYSLHAEWFKTALQSYGGVDHIIAALWRQFA